MIAPPPLHEAPRARRTAQDARNAPEAPLAPFTLPHFRAWAAQLTLDTDRPWLLEPFQEGMLEDIFAGVPEVWIVIPEGNTKTTTLAGLGLYHAEFRPMASVPVAASSREQAEIMYRQAEGFVLRSPRLYEAVHSSIQAAKGKQKTEVPRFVCLEGYRRINHFDGSRIQIFAADDRTGDGVIPTLGLVDELHRHRDLALYRTWVGKILKRGGQVVTISTRGEPGTDFELTLAQIKGSATDVRHDGFHTRYRSGRVVLHEWAVPEGADVDDIDLVKAANPFSGVTREALLEKHASPTMTRDYWTRFVCNQPTRGSTAAIQEAEWDAADARPAEIPVGEPIWLGLDVSWKWDTTSGVPYWWKSADYRLMGPALILEPPRDSTSLDINRIKVGIRKIHARNPIHTVVMDVSRAKDVAEWIEQEIGATVLDWLPSNKVAVQEFDRFMEGLRGGQLKHSGDAGLRSHALNAIAYMLPSGDAKFERTSQSQAAAAQDRRVIDALKAAAMVNCAAVELELNKPKPRSKLFAGAA